MDSIRRVVIVGGGSAGWITAGLLAAEHRLDNKPTLDVTLVESPDVATIGVGEGTWPSMRQTLKKIGISETDFLNHCNASFKQGSCFSGWYNGDKRDKYYHPFSMPSRFASLNLANHWLELHEQVDFAYAVTSQAQVCDSSLAPKQSTTPEYAFNLNYGYHLDAEKFAELLQQHCTKQLGVKHVKGHVRAVVNDTQGYIKELELEDREALEGDLFIDCSGAKGRLISQHYQVEFVSVKRFLFNDRAIATQVSYPNKDSEIASTTIATAQVCGWTWDIGLQSRRGLGYVYSSQHQDEAAALEVLQRQIRSTDSAAKLENLDFRELKFEPGYRQQFWVKNCVAVGMSAGFIEPLEASALALVEQSAKMITEQFPQSRTTMALLANKFNSKFVHHWQSIISFLKLHYLENQHHDQDYWLDAKSEQTTPEALFAQMALWQNHPPWHEDAPRVDELFPAASWQYILYGLRYQKKTRVKQGQQYEQDKQLAAASFNEIRLQQKKVLQSLPGNRELLNYIQRYK